MGVGAKKKKKTEVQTESVRRDAHIKPYLHFESENVQVSNTSALTSVTARAATKPTVKAIADILENICSGRARKVYKKKEETKN